VELIWLEVLLLTLMAKAGGYNFFFVFALQSSVSLKFGLKLVPSFLGLFHRP